MINMKKDDLEFLSSLFISSLDLLWKISFIQKALSFITVLFLLLYLLFLTELNFINQ
jgi:hypothetical protein